MAGTVLYIDDRAQIPDRVDELLTQAGYELAHTRDPAEALRIARDERPALILIEVLLSGQDGFELIRRIDRVVAAPPLPIVVVTSGERTPQLYGRALELGVEDFLCKPVVGAQILEAVLAFARQDGTSEPRDETAVPSVAAFGGSLGDQPLPQLIGRLHRAGASGVLTVEQAPETRSVLLRNGSPIEIEKHRDVVSVADYLRSTRRIDGQQYEMLVDQMMAGLGGPREILLGMGALSESQLATATQEQARGVLLELFDWTVGQFEFQPGQELTCAETLELVIDPTKLVLGGLKRTPNEVVRTALDRRSNLYVSTSNTSGKRLTELGLTEDQCTNIDGLVGDRTVAEVMASNLFGDRLLYGLYATGTVLFEKAPVLSLDEELKLDEMVEVPTLPRSVNSVAKTPRDPRPAKRASIGDVPESLIEEIAEQLDARNDFELFGIDASSRDADVRIAYDKLLGSLRPDDIPAERGELRNRVRDLRLRLEQAYQRVRTEDSRIAFAGIRNGRPAERREEDVGSRAVDAESWFRTGEGYIANENYDQAIEALGMAVHLDPDQGDYAAFLGYALYRSRPEDSVIRREALEHVAKGVKLAPGREKPLLFLSRIFRETGDVQMAGKVLRRALQTNPDSPALIQEMCLVREGGAKPKPRKLLDRIRGR